MPRTRIVAVQKNELPCSMFSNFASRNAKKIDNIRIILLLLLLLYIQDPSLHRRNLIKVLGTIMYKGFLAPLTPFPMVICPSALFIFLLAFLLPIRTETSCSNFRFFFPLLPLGGRKFCYLCLFYQLAVVYYYHEKFLKFSIRAGAESTLR